MTFPYFLFTNLPSRKFLTSMTLIPLEYFPFSHFPATPPLFIFHTLFLLPPLTSLTPQPLSPLLGKNYNGRASCETLKNKEIKLPKNFILYYKNYFFLKLKMYTYVINDTNMSKRISANRKNKRLHLKMYSW